MPRRGNIAKRDVLADPIYNSKMVTRLINNVMYDGKKGVAQKIVYDAFEIVKEKTGNDPLESFEKALENIMPVLECKSRRVGGANYQVPMEVRPARRETLGLLSCPQRAHHVRAFGRRDHGCLQRQRRRLQKARGYSQDGRGQQGLCSLQILISVSLHF